MSTTVQYKGNTLTTVSNDTKTLKTAGKYMEGDVVLTDVSGGSGAISVVDTTDTHGGTIRTITAVDISDTTAVASDVAQGKYFYTADGTKTAGTSSGGDGDTWSWMGKNPTLYKTPLNQKVYLKDTDWVNWAPSATASVVIAQTALTSETLDCSNYGYIQVNRFHVHFEYTPDSTGKNLINDYYYSNGYNFEGYRTNTASMTSGDKNTCTFSQLTSSYGFFYISSSGDEQFNLNTYGLYLSGWQNTSASSNGTNYTFTPVKPNINARCNSTYFSTTNAQAVDQDTSYYEMKIEIWRVDSNSTPLSGSLNGVYDMRINGF